MSSTRTRTRSHSHTAPDSIPVQAQIRRNAMEQNEVLKGLSSWEEDMKKREDSSNTMQTMGMRTSTQTDDDTGRSTSRHGNNPRCFDTLSKSESGSELKHIPDENDPDTKIRMAMAKNHKSSIIMRTGGGDDHILSSSSSLSSSTTKFPKPVKVPVVPSTILKSSNPSSTEMEEEQRQRGNQFYSTKRYDEALKCYTKCILMNPKSVAAYSNRGTFAFSFCICMYLSRVVLSNFLSFSSFDNIPMLFNDVYFIFHIHIHSY